MSTKYKYDEKLSWEENVKLSRLSPAELKEAVDLREAAAEREYEKILQENVNNPDFDPIAHMFHGLPKETTFI